MDVVANIIVNRGPVLASIAVIATTVFFATLLFGNGSTSQLPLVGKEYGNAEKRRKAFITKGLEFYKKGYALYKSKAFRLTSLDGTRAPYPGGQDETSAGNKVLMVQ